MPLGHNRSLLLAIFLFLLVGLSSCGLQDQPFTLFGSDENPINTAPPGGGGPIPPGEDDCAVHFQGSVQLKASANPDGAPEPFEVLDGDPIPIDQTIPIKVDGNQVFIEGNQFPDIYFRPEADGHIKISGTPGNVASGTYDASTGEMLLSGLILTLQIVQPGTTELLLPGEFSLPPVDLTTGSVQATGNLNSISETGQPLNSSDLSLVLVAGLTLPDDFGDLGVGLNGIIGGGALTARFEGSLDRVPSGSCEGGGPPVEGGTSPLGAGLKVSVKGQPNVDSIDFGNSLVLTKNIGEQVKLNCAVLNYGEFITRTVTITNTGSDSRQVSVDQPQDTDHDFKKDSIHCSNEAEFIRGSVVTQGGAFCNTVEVGGKTFETGDCTLPEAGSAISFMVGYLPYNYHEIPEGGEPLMDTGELELIADGDQTAKMQLMGRTLIDNRKSFSISKMIGTKISQRKIPNQGQIKISLYNDPASDQSTVSELLQQYVLRNSGSDEWKIEDFTLQDGSTFQVTQPNGTLPPSPDGIESGTVGFEIKFDPTNPNQAASFEDKLTVNLSKVGDPNITSKFEVRLLGTSGIAPITGLKWQMHFDFVAAMIDDPLVGPIESPDFRKWPHLAPAPFILDFETDEIFDGVQRVKMDLSDLKNIQGNDDLANLSVEQRKKILRLFTTRLSYKDGSELPSDALPGEPNTCQDPVEIKQVYQDGKCSYFYWIIESVDNGLYIDETGDFVLPDLQIRMLNPYHAGVGTWGKSDPNGNPSYILDAPLTVSLSTYTLEQKTLVEEITGESLPLVSSTGFSNGDLNVQNKQLGGECPDGYLDATVSPKFRCYLSSDERYMQGRIFSTREGYTDQYEFVLVGATRMPPAQDDNTPWFLDGTLMYLAVQGRLCPEGSSCQY